MFIFQQFTIDDSHCAMKVGTDGVLLGAWAAVEGARRVLDIGCGSGLIALMAAQRNAEALVTGVEIDPAAAADARANAAASPFGGRVRIVCGDVLRMTQGGPVPAPFAPPYDCILANPPYHEEDLLPPSASRAAARHTSGGGLTFAALLRAVVALLPPVENGTDGEETVSQGGGADAEKAEAKRDAGGYEPRFSLILPTQALPRFIPLAAVHGLYVCRRTQVVTRPGKPSKRTLLELSRSKRNPATDTLVLLAPDGSRSEQYAHLCRHFYLNR